MKCKSCNEDVDVKMKKALEQNKCPYCGNAILDSITMQQFLDLYEVFGPVRLTDSEWHDIKIKENVIKILMDQMQCTRKKQSVTIDNVVKLSERPPTAGPATVAATASTASPEAAEVRKMRSEIYEELQTQQYGSNDEVVSEEDIAAAQDVVFSEAVNEKVAALKVKAAASPARRISRVES